MPPRILNIDDRTNTTTSSALHAHYIDALSSQKFVRRNAVHIYSTQTHITKPTETNKPAYP
ncbi:hypothetical protein SFSGTM_02420 [Sulfuriferula nivalis]|uniref:Uncharacterized protein n=1 Tax=Sulfuriferula nivalis TaxID=2675298 RepID=A0A809RF82_9PROT|nr:hypothetical protein SFSGTM_02420 [Sulfuriferula nivalis]